MNKLVYLFELDSVRNSDDQMELAMKALFREIVVNGNIVVITYNQLIDSRFFLSLLNDEKWSDVIIKLFQSGAIRISQFGNFRTPSQYLINRGLDSNENYIFSGLPIKSSQKSLIALTKRSLMYSDLTELNEYISRVRSDAELKVLFRERNIEKDKDNKISIVETTLDFEGMMNTLKDLKAVLKLILEFSSIQNAYNPPKKKENSINVNLDSYLNHVKDIKNTGIAFWDEAIAILKCCLKDVNDTNKRSLIVKEIINEYNYNKKTENAFEKYSLAQAIVDICYNYTCEQSICNISKHYNINEFIDNSNYKTFNADFLLRLKQYLGNRKSRINHFLKEESNDFVPYDFKRYWFCNLKRAAHLLDHTKSLKKDNENESVKVIYPYEYKIHSQQLIQRLTLLFGVGRKISLTIVFLLIAFIIENFIYDGIEDFLNTVIEIKIFENNRSFLLIVIASFISALFVELLSGFISKVIKKTSDYTKEHTVNKKEINIDFPTFGESLENFITQIGDLICAIISLRVPYYNKINSSLLKPIPADQINPIDYVSTSISDYKKYREKHCKDTMFAKSDIYPILDVSTDSVDVRLTRIEEMTGKSYGILYKSIYHTLIVDPIEKITNTNNDNYIFAYERMNSTSTKAGVVIVPEIIENNETYLVLVKQFRHSIRDYQINFPRGFNEFNLDDNRLIELELNEEINAGVLKDSVVTLGYITADSGILSGFVRIVKATISNCCLVFNKEGIVDVIKIKPAELDEKIVKGEISDGFTISAYSLWKLKHD